MLLPPRCPAFVLPPKMLLSYPFHWDLCCQIETMHNLKKKGIQQKWSHRAVSVVCHLILLVHKGCHALLSLVRAIGPAFPDKSCKHDCFCPFQQHGVHSDFRGCPLKCGPAGGAAAPGPAAVHRAPPLLSHVSGQCRWLRFATVQPLISNAAWCFDLSET